MRQHCCRTQGESPRGGVAQLVEHLLCKQRVVGSNPVASTTLVTSSNVEVNEQRLAHS